MLTEPGVLGKSRETVCVDFLRISGRIQNILELTHT